MYDKSQVLVDRDIVVLSDDWHGNPTSTIHLIKQLLPENRIFWMTIVNRFPQLRWNDLKKVARVVGDSWTQSKRRITDESQVSPVVVTPLIIPSFIPLIRRLNRRNVARAFDRLSIRYKFRKPLVITTFPATADFLETVDADLKIYYCVDDWGNYPGLNSQKTNAIEQKLFQVVDGVVATSRMLQQKAPANLPSLYLPQGVDFSHFDIGSNSQREIPGMERIKRPIVGFFGLISEWLDFELMNFLGRSCPDVSFVYIGKSDVPSGSIEKLPNVHLTGQVDYSELPAWARYFDAGLIPFKINDLTRSVNPLKLMEYFALGIPVISTRLPDLIDVDGPIFFGANKEEIRNALRLALRTNRDESGKHATTVARQNSWGFRAMKLSQFVMGIEQ